MFDDIQRLEEKVSNLITEILKLREENLILSERARAFELISDTLEKKERYIEDLHRKNEVLELKIKDALERLSEKTDEINRLSELNSIKDEITVRVKNLIEKISLLETQQVEKTQPKSPLENEMNSSETDNEPTELGANLDNKEESIEEGEREITQVEKGEEDKSIIEEKSPKIIYNKMNITKKGDDNVNNKDGLKEDIISLEEDIDEEEVSDEKDNLNIFDDITIPEKEKDKNT